MAFKTDKRCYDVTDFQAYVHDMNDIAHSEPVFLCVGLWARVWLILVYRFKESQD